MGTFRFGKVAPLTLVIGLNYKSLPLLSKLIQKSM
jgi:hypothetical protein